jgi:outer membrane lipoprotein carrier protein
MPAGRAETSAQAAPVVRALEARYRAAKTLKAVFLERYQDGRSGLQVESGTVYFSRPGRMRWEYESPEPKLFVTDGKLVWFFVPADHTVTRSPMKSSSDLRTPLALLTGKVKLAELCADIAMSATAPGVQGQIVLSCLPRGATRQAGSSAQDGDVRMGVLSPAERLDRVLLEVDPVTGELSDVRVSEPGGVELEYRFGNWQDNLPLEESLFHFEPPRGVDIVDASDGSR